GARVANAPFRLEPDLDSLSRWEAVRDERRLERDDRLAVRERVAYLVGNDHGIAPSRPTQRAAASSPRRPASSSDQPSKKPAASASPAPVASATSTGSGARSIRASGETIVQPRAPRLRTASGAVMYAPPRISHSASVAKITSGASVSRSSRKRTGP